MATYRFKLGDEQGARAFVHALTLKCKRLCIYRTGAEVSVIDGSTLGQREEIYSIAWALHAKMLSSP